MIKGMRIVKFVILYLTIWVGISITWQRITYSHIYLREFLFIQLLTIVVIAVGIALLHLPASLAMHKRKTGYFSHGRARLSEVWHGWTNKFHRTQQSEPPEVVEVNVPGYGTVRPCCYNSARLGDLYCLCGRSIPEELFVFLKS